MTNEPYKTADNKRRHVVLLSAFVCDMLSGGYFYGNSRLLSAIIATFNSTKAEAGVIMSSNSATFSLFSIVSGAIVQKFGPKSVGIVSTFMFSLAVSLSYFASSILYLVLIQAVFAGIGCSLINLSTNLVVAECFEGKSKMMALSVLICGGGTGGMMYSYLLQVLIETYGLRGTYLIVGGIVLNIFALILVWPNKTNQNELNTKPDNSTARNMDISATDEGNEETVIEISLKESMKTVFRKKTFVLFAFGTALIITAQIGVLIYMADLINEKYHDSIASSLAVFLYNLLSIFGRLIPGFLNQLPFPTAQLVPIAITVSSVTGSLMLAYLNIEYLTLAACGVIGVSFGMTAALMTLATVQILGNQNMPIGYGLILSINGIMALSFGPAIGYIRDTTGSYTGVYIAIATMACIGGMLLITSIWMTNRQTSTK